MATKTISLRIEAHERLRAARLYPGESFSDIVLRATWPQQTIAAGEFLRLRRARGVLLNQAHLDRVEELKLAVAPPTA